MNELRHTAKNGAAIEIPVGKSEGGIRLDAWLRRQLPQFSRTALARLIGEGRITVGEHSVKPRYMPKAGDCIRICLPPDENREILPEAMPLEILFEDEHLLVLNKAAGLCVHPATGRLAGTLVNGLLHHCRGELSNIGGPARAGIVHRLDQGTSGCIVAAKTNLAHENLIHQFAKRAVEKGYQAIACGRVSPLEGAIQAKIARHPSRRKRMIATEKSGRAAHTQFRVIEHFSDASLVDANLRTGRTHQIRVHFQYLGFPLFGDALYGARKTQRLAAKIRFQPKRQMLHARKLAFDHPTAKRRIRLQAPLPPDFEETLRQLRTP